MDAWLRNVAGPDLISAGPLPTPEMHPAEERVYFIIAASQPMGGAGNVSNIGFASFTEQGELVRERASRSRVVVAATQLCAVDPYTCACVPMPARLLRVE